MSADVLSHTIDLTNEPDSPPTTPRRRASSESSDVVFVGSSTNLPPPGPHRTEPAAGWRIVQERRSLPRSEEHITIDSDDDNDDRDEENPRPMPPAAFRIFSPPAQFSQPPASGSRDRQRPAPPITPPPRIRLGGGLVALRDRAPPSRYHSQDAARRAGASMPTPPRPPRRNMINRFFDTFASVFGNGPGEGNGGDILDRYHGIRYDIDLPRGPGTAWDAVENHIAAQGRYPTFYVGGWGAGLAAAAAAEEEGSSKAVYHHSMTHRRDFPRRGFSFDFDPDGTSASAPIVIDDDAGPSSSSSASASASASAAARSGTPAPSSTLVCPRCRERLLAGSRTMWALRCGHVICATCIQDISRPAPTWEKGKGKENETESDDQPVMDKGKGKATETSDEMTPEVLPGRRTRKGGLIAPTTRQLRSGAKPPTTNDPSTSPGPSASRKRRHASTLTKPGTIAEEWEYNCPVTYCRRCHWSVKLWEVKSGVRDEDAGEWVWKQKEKSGAVPIYT